MKKDIKNISDTCIEVIVSFDKESIAKKELDAINEICKNANVPGFRIGKVPASVAKAKFGSNIKDMLKSELVRDAIKDIEDDKTINVYMVTDVQTEDDSDGIRCTFKVDIEPSFDLPDYKTLSITINEEGVSEKEIENVVLDLKKNYSKYNVVERKVQNGDFVKVSYCGKLENGDEIASKFPNLKIYGTQNGAWEEAGNKESYGVHCVSDSIVGMSKGNKKTISTNFSEDLEAKDLAGKKATYDIEVLEVRERIFPELDAEFLKTLNVESEEILRKNIKENLKTKKNEKAYLEKRDIFLDDIEKSLDFQIPASAIDKETTSMMRIFIKQQLSQGAKHSDLAKEEENISQAMHNSAIERAKLGFILDKVAKLEKIEVENADLEKMLMQDAMMQRVRPEQLIKELQNDRDVIIDMRSRVLRGKTLDFLMKIAIENGKKATSEHECQCLDIECKCKTTASSTKCTKPADSCSCKENPVSKTKRSCASKTAKKTEE